MSEKDIGQTMITAAMKVHSALGSGLLQSAYELCLVHEPTRRGSLVRKQVPIARRYEDLTVDDAYRIDLLVNNRLVVAGTALEAVLPVHRGRLLSYPGSGEFKLGYRPNVTVARSRDGITRMLHGL